MTQLIVTDNKEKTHKIIKNHMIWSMGAGVIPFPIVDIFAITAVQLDMVKQLSKVYDIDYKENEGKAVITSLAGTSVSQIGTSALKLIPGIGTLIGGLTKAVFAGATTYAIGEVFKKHFETGGTFLDFDPDRLREYYHEKFEKGKDIARDLEKDKVAPEEIENVSDEETAPERSSVDQLVDLAKLKEDGLLTDKEFEKLKKKILKG